MKLPLTDMQFSLFTGKGSKNKVLVWKCPECIVKEFYFVENDILYRTIIDNGHKLNAAVVPEELTDTVSFSRAQSIWSQWVPEDICCNKM